MLHICRTGYPFSDTLSSGEAPFGRGHLVADDTSILSSHQPTESSDSSSLSTHQETETSHTNELSTHCDSENPSEYASSSNSCDDSMRVRQTKRRRLSQPLRNYSILYQVTCCKNVCIQDFSPAELKDVELTFKDIGNEVKQKQYILDNIRQHSVLSMKGKRKHTETDFRILGKPVCVKAWREMHNISQKRYENCVRMYKDGVINVVHGNADQIKMKSKTTMALTWMRFLFERIGDWMPHKTEVHLPKTSSKKMFYQRMCKEFEEDYNIKPEDNISYEYFTTIWAEHLPEFKIPKTSEFVECSICAQLKEDRNRAKTKQEKEIISELLKKHFVQVETERKVYHATREQARFEPDEIMCIIQDGMDQKKTAIPRLVNEDKMTSLLARIRLHITGNIIHTNVPGGKIIPAYVDLLNYPHDSNLSMHLLLQTLFDNRARLSRCLFTQLDNCYRENKNRYMLSLAHVLVQYKVFDMVDLHFLPVGHTHEDIDQLFSCISRHLKKTNIYTMDDMERAVMNSYNVPVFVKHVEGVFDIKKWLLPHMVKNFKGQSKPLHFQFKEFDGKVRMRYRHRSTSNWRPVLQFKDDDFTPIEESKGLICLKTLPNVDDVPEWVKPSIEKMDPERLRKDLPDAYQGRITCERDKQWLREFAQNINDHAKAPSSRPQRWFLHDLIDAAKQRRDRQQNTSMPDHILSIQQNIENECPDVVIGRPIPTSEDRGNSLEKMDDFSSLKEGMLVAVYLPDVKRQPQIGKVVCLKTEEEVLTLHWYTGSWKAAWKATYRGVGRNRRPNTQIIWIQASIMWDFSLTPSGMLPKQTRTQLHERYREIEDESDQEQ